MDRPLGDYHGQAPAGLASVSAMGYRPIKGAAPATTVRSAYFDNRHAELAQHLAWSGYALWASNVTMRARSFGSEVPQGDAVGACEGYSSESPSAALLETYFQLLHHGMKSRNAYAYLRCRSLRALNHSIALTKRTKNIFSSETFQGR